MELQGRAVAGAAHSSARSYVGPANSHVRLTLRYNTAVQTGDFQLATTTAIITITTITGPLTAVGRPALLRWLRYPVRGL